MVVQDDSRERQLIELFELERIKGAGRGDTDAKLVLASGDIPFELKSSTYDSVTTARDVSPLHLEKWRKEHWLFGFYEADGKTLKYCLYGSPAVRPQDHSRLAQSTVTIKRNSHRCTMSDAGDEVERCPTWSPESMTMF
jgi:hypothetical protein